MNTFPKSARLLKHPQFKQTLDHGKKFVTREFVAFATMQQEAVPSSKIGFIVSKKVGKAHIRNRAKRLMRESFRLLSPEQSLYNCHIVLIARHNIIEADLATVQKSLVFSFSRLKNMLTH